MAEPPLAGPAPEDRRENWLPPVPVGAEPDDSRRRWIKGCAAFGSALVVSGLVLALVEDSAISMTGTNDYLCASENLNKAVPAGLWILWLLLLVAAVRAYSLRKRMVHPDRLSSRLAMLGLLSAFALFPGWLVLGTGMNCAL